MNRQSVKSRSCVVCFATLFSFVAAGGLSIAHDAGRRRSGDDPIASPAPVSGDAALIEVRRDELAKLESRLEERRAAVKAEMEDFTAPQVRALADAERALADAESAESLAAAKVREYENASFPGELKRANQAIASEELALKIAKEQVDAVKKHIDEARGAVEVYAAANDAGNTAVTKAQLQMLASSAESARLWQLRASIGVTQAKRKRDLLTQYEKRKTIVDLEAEVDKAKANTEAMRGKRDMEKAELDAQRALRDELQIANPDAFVLRLLDDAIDAQQQMAPLLNEASELTKTTTADAASAKKIEERLGEIRRRVQELRDLGAERASRAVVLGRMAQESRSMLRDLEREAQAAREHLELLEKGGVETERK